jgi:hypothetical protein
LLVRHWDIHITASLIRYPNWAFNELLNWIRNVHPMRNRDIIGCRIRSIDYPGNGVWNAPCNCLFNRHRNGNVEVTIHIVWDWNASRNI